MSQQYEFTPKEPPISLPEQKTKNYRLILLMCSLFFCLVLLLFLPKSLTPSFPSSEQQINHPTPTPMPFEELTVPFLRKKEYKSTLMERLPIYSNTQYLSYLTHYISDGYKINALLTIPTQEKPPGGYKAIVFVHGYIPPSQYETVGPSYAAYIDYLARNNFVVFKIDLRGHGNSEGEPGGGYYGADYVIDTLNARAALQNTDFVDPAKIGLWGHSMAGNILLRSAVIQPTIPAISIWAGAVFTYSDWQKYGINDNSYRPPTVQNETRKKRQKLIETHGQFSTANKFWQEFAPTNYIKAIQGSIQIHHAIDDQTVPIGYSRDLADLLKKNNISHTLYEYSSGGHNISGDSFTRAMERTVAFFHQYLD